MLPQAAASTAMLKMRNKRETVCNVLSLILVIPCSSVETLGGSFSGSFVNVGKRFHDASVDGRASSNE